MHVEWQRSTVAPPADDGAEPQLEALVREEIGERGPITFARFMERALYEPGLGYYATSTLRPTRAGDFLTAAELHPIFGQTIARQVDEMWRRMDEPTQFVVREYGAGAGALYLVLVEGLVAMDSPLARDLQYQPIDQPAQLKALSAAAAAIGRSVATETSSLPPISGCIIANEFVDALPVHRVSVIEGKFVELYVDWRDGQFVEHPAEPSDERLAAWFSDSGVALAEGQRAEVNLAMLEWLTEVGRQLERGYVLILDYGAPAAELYGPGRLTGTLRAFAGHHVSSDVLSGTGRRDLTAHVDLDALGRGARAAGLTVLGRARQAEFLLGCGLDEVYATARAEADLDWPAALGLRSAVRRLLDPAALGGYEVTILGRGVDTQPALRGLAARQ